MRSLSGLKLLGIVLSACALAAAASSRGIASTTTTGASSATHTLITLTPTNLHQTVNSSECLQHVYNHGQGYYEHVAFGCSHPTQNYIHLVWDYTGKADGFHIYRTDSGRQDYGIHNDGTVAQIYYTGGRACFVVTAVTGKTESQDSNQYCILPSAVQQRVIPH
jgi:hypothetical protein